MLGELLTFLGELQNGGGALVMLVILFLRQEHYHDLFERHEELFHNVKRSKVK